MTGDVKHVRITDELAKVIGKPTPGTRMYHADGDDRDFRRFWKVLMRHFPRGVVSPGGACQYAGVSRAAIHQAMKEGRLTVFCFHAVKEQRGVFGAKLVRTSPYLYLPIIELRAWRVELEERIGRLHASGIDLAEIYKQLKCELEGAKPDWDARFVDDHPDGRVVRRKRR